MEFSSGGEMTSNPDVRKVTFTGVNGSGTNPHASKRRDDQKAFPRIGRERAEGAYVVIAGRRKHALDEVQTALPIL